MQAPNHGGSSEREKELEQRVESLERQLERALAEIERLRKELEEALRANQRSGAPFFQRGTQEEPQAAGTQAGRGVRSASYPTGTQPGG